MATASRRLQHNNISAIFLDLDNTIIPTRCGDKATIEQIRCVLVQEYGVPPAEASNITQKFLRTFRRYPENQEMTLAQWRVALWRRALGDAYESLAEIICQSWLSIRYQNLKPTEEVLEMLRFLKIQYSLALITNGPSCSQWEKIRQLDVAKYFDCILVSGDLGWAKPSKGIFLLACEQLEVQPENCIMVGDRLETDILGAHKAGLAAGVWVPLKDTTEDVNVEPDITIPSVTMLPNILQCGKPKLNRYLDLSEPESENSNCSMGS